MKNFSIKTKQAIAFILVLLMTMAFCLTGCTKGNNIDDDEAVYFEEEMGEEGEGEGEEGGENNKMKMRRSNQPTNQL